MEIADILTIEAVLPSLRAASKKQVLQELAAVAAEQTGQDRQFIFDLLLQREKLGSTGVGDGIAIPHARLPGITQVRGIFARLEKPVAFDAVDDKPVDLIFLLLAPQTSRAEHLKALARISRMLRDRLVCEKIRNSESTEALYILLTQHDEDSD